MGCLTINTPTGKMFICGKGMKPIHCKECGCHSEYLCDFPVGKDKTCDAKLCDDHAHEVAPNIHYCKSHHEEWLKFKEDVVPFASAFIRGHRI